MKKNKIIICIFLFLILSNYSFAQNFRVVTENFPPYNYTKNGVVEGFSSSIVKAVLKAFFKVIWKDKIIVSSKVLVIKPFMIAKSIIIIVCS